MMTLIAGVVGFLLGRSHRHHSTSFDTGLSGAPDHTVRPYIESCRENETMHVTRYGKPLFRFGFVRTEPYKQS
jgi:hypothetical protein